MDEEEEFFQSRIGTVLREKWKLERLLGYGGMAAVYVGLHTIGRRDAIKMLHPEMAVNKELRARFEQEAHAVNRLQHPGVVRVLDIEVAEDGSPFLVMELLEGESLHDRMTRGPIPIPDVLRFTDELLDVLTAAHATGIIHRDIKPDNLFITNDGRLKVLDFGIARMRQGAPKTIYTRMGVTIGTLSYMPPEQVAGKEIDGRADLFAVGCTLFRVIAGRNPHQGHSDLELMAKMGMEPAPPLRSAAPTAPLEVALLVDRALAFDRDQRYPDAVTMQSDVRAVREGKAPPYASRALSAPTRAVFPPPAGAGAAADADGGADAAFEAARVAAERGRAPTAAMAMPILPSAMSAAPPGALAPHSVHAPTQRAPKGMPFGLPLWVWIGGGAAILAAFIATILIVTRDDDRGADDPPVNEPTAKPGQKAPAAAPTGHKRKHGRKKHHRRGGGPDDDDR